MGSYGLPDVMGYKYDGSYRVWIPHIGVRESRDVAFYEGSAPVLRRSNPRCELDTQPLNHLGDQPTPMQTTLSTILYTGDDSSVSDNRREAFGRMILAHGSWLKGVALEARRFPIRVTVGWMAFASRNAVMIFYQVDVSLAVAILEWKEQTFAAGLTCRRL